MSLRCLSFPLLSIFFFSSFIQELPTTSFDIILVNKIFIGPSKRSLLTSLIFIPWAFKPLLGYISDIFPLYNLRRKPYLIICFISLGITYIIFGSFCTTNLCLFIIASFVASIFSAFAEVVMDAIIVEIVNNRRNHKDTLHHTALSVDYQSLAMISRTCGSICAAAVSMGFLALIKPMMIIIITAAFCFTAVIPLFFLTDVVDCASRNIRWKSISQLLRFYHIPMFVLFAFALMPSSDITFSTFIIGTFDYFSNWQFGLFKFIGLAGGLVGAVVFWRVFAECYVSKSFFITTILCVLGSASRIILSTHTNLQLGIADIFYVPTDALFIAFFNRLAFLPCLVLATQCSPINLEATFFGLLTSLSHVASISSAALSALLTTALGITRYDFSNLWILILICDGCAFLPFLLLPKLSKFYENRIELCNEFIPLGS